MREQMKTFLRTAAEKMGIAIYFDDEVQAMIEGTLAQEIDHVIDVAYQEAYFFVAERFIAAGFEEDYVDRVLNAVPEWVSA